MLESTKFATHLAALLDSARILNHTSESVNAIIEAFEHALVNANIGIETWLDQDSQHEICPTAIGRNLEGNKSQMYTELGFARIESGWRLVKREVSVTFDSHGDCESWEYAPATPLATASRGLRIAALPHLPALVNSLRMKTEAAIAAIADAKRLILC